MEKHYSGDNSKEFWDLINSMPDELQGEAYSLGCVLQSVESRILALIKLLVDESLNSGSDNTRIGGDSIKELEKCTHPILIRGKCAQCDKVLDGE